MQEIKKTVYNVTVYGKAHELSAPSMRKIKEFQEASLKNPEKELDLTIDFLVSLGMDSESAWDLEGDHVKKVIAQVTGKKNA